MKHSIRFNRTRRGVAFVLALTIALSAIVPIYSLEVSATTGDPYYDEYGVTYEQLFTLYPQYLSSDVESQVTDTVISVYADVLDDHTAVDNFIASYIYVLREDAGFSYSLREIWAAFNLGESTEEQMMLDTITLLLQNIAGKSNVFSEVVSDVEERFSVVKGVYDLTTDAGKENFINAIKKACTGLSDEKIDEIAEQLFSKELSKQFNQINAAVAISDVVASLFIMHELETEIIDIVKDSVPENSGIKEAIDAYQKKRSTPAIFIATYVNDKVLGILENGLLDAISFGVPLTKVAMSTISLAATVLYRGPDTADVYRATALGGYVQGIYSAILSKRIEFRQTELVGADEIADYQVLYTAYVESIRTTLESTKLLATDIQKGNIDTAISICDKLTYDKYISLCMAELKADIDAGVVAPPGGIAGNIAACVKEVYPSYGTIVITKANANIMDRPCSVNTDAASQLIESGALNAEYIVTGLYKNTADNYWYQIQTKKGEVGYIYSGNCSHSAYLSDVSVTGLDVPTRIDVGSRYYIKGRISTVYTNLTNISFQVYDENGNRRTGGTVDVAGKSYVLDNSAIDTAAEFNILGAGTYHCVLEATVENYSASECYREKVLLQTNELVVGNTGSAGNTVQSDVIYTDLLLNINWSNIDRVGRQTPDSYSCSCFALAYSRTILDNTVHYFYEYNQYGNTEYQVNALWYLGHHGSIVYSTANEVFRKLYSDLCNGKPVIVYVTGRGSTGHYVTVIGFQNVSSLTNLSAHNFLIIDPVYNDGHVGVNMGGVGYSLNSYQQVVYDQSSLKVSFSATNNLACSHSYTGVDTPSTCFETGIRKYTCSKCGDTYIESIPALGHDYQGFITAPTCSSAGFTTYTCSRCNDSYIEGDEKSWSDWSASYPEGINSGLIQNKTEYRYQDKETTTSTSSELPGWTLIGPTTIYGDYGAWSAWGDSPISASDNTKVETRTVWPYYYFLCGNCGAHMHGYGTCYTWAGGCGAATYDTGWRPVWSTTSWDNAGLMDWYGTGKYYTHINGELVFQLAGVSTKTQYRSCTREIVDGYSFYRWGDWSDWSDTPYTANDERNVEERTVYRYYTGPLGEHSWDEGTVTTAPTCTVEGMRTHNCLLCGATENRAIPVIDHQYTSEVIGATCTEYAYVLYTCIDCGHSYEDHTDQDYSEWSEEYPDGVEETLIETKTEYRYSDFETLTSYEPELEGYGLISSEWQESDSGTITYVSSWPSGFNTGHSLYPAYNKSPKTAIETETDRTVINSNTHTGYIYWHWCRGTYAEGPINRTISDHATSEYGAFHAFYSTSSGSAYDPSGNYGNGAHYYPNGSCCRDSYWYYPINVMTQNYTSYKNLFTYGRWTEWSDWSETEYSEDTNRKVESRTMYRYLTAPSGAHSWDDGIVTAPTCTEAGYTTYTCTVCGGTYTDHETDALGHTEITIPGKKVTCVETGLTEGVKCSVCDKILIEQNEIPRKDHSFEMGVCTVCGEKTGDIAMNVTTGVGYATLAEALEDPQEGEIVILLENSTENRLMILPGVTLDLNGNTLTANYLVAFETANVVDSVGTGRMNIGQRKMVLDENNTMVPVFDGEGYIFTKVGFALRKDSTYTGEGFRINSLAYPVNMDVVELLKDGGEDNNIQILIRLNWDTDDGTGSQEFAFTDKVVGNVYSSNQGTWNKYSKMFTMTITGFANISNLRANLAIVSGTDVQYVSSTSINIT